MKESEVRRIINSYSRRTSGHPFNDYGNNIKIRVNDDCLIYECRIKTQYENRDVERKSRPYRGWDVAPQKYFSAHDISAWSYKLRTPEDFVDRETVLEIEGSANVSSCSPCRGSGNFTCYTCNGKGKSICSTCGGNYSNLTCSSCDGEGKIRCSQCNGQGLVECSKCHGKGSYEEQIQKYVIKYDYNRQKNVGGYEWVTEKITCRLCGGRGGNLCRTCNGRGRYTCKRCDGRGSVTCPDCTKGLLICKSCSGEGKLACRICEGAGSNESRFVVNRSLFHDVRRGFVCDKRVRKFAETHEIPYTGTDFHAKKKALTGELYPENVRCSSKLAELLSKTEPESGIILFQEATVLHVDSTVVEYDFNGSSYGGIICNDVFYPNGSPIEEWAANLVDSAEKKLKTGSSVKTLQMLEQAENAGADHNIIRNLRDKALKKLGNLQDAGVSLAFWFVVLAISPIVFNFYSKLNPVAPWAIVTNNPNWKFTDFVPVCQTFIFLVMAVAMRFVCRPDSRSGNRNYSSIWTYFIKGFFSYLLASLACLVSLLLVNYLGLSIVTTFIFGIVFLIIALVISLAVLMVRWIVQLF